MLDKTRVVSRSSELSKLFSVVTYIWKLQIIVTKSSILDATRVLDLPLYAINFSNFDLDCSNVSCTSILLESAR